MDRLLTGPVDMLLTHFSDSHADRKLSFEPLMDEEHAVVAGYQHPLAGKVGLQLRDLCKQPWILLSPGSRVCDELAALFAQQGLRLPRNLVQTSSLPVIVTLLRIARSSCWRRFV